MTPLRVRLIVREFARGWIMEKFAHRLEENLPAFGVKVDIGSEPSEDAQVNHFILYHEVSGEKPTRGLTTTLITHVDDPLKKALLARDLASRLDAAVCLSSETRDLLVAAGLPAAKLCYITPAHDGVLRPRRLVIGFTSRVYADGRKREWLLERLAQAMRLDAFHFDFFGQGWEPLIPKLEAAGATVRHRPGTADYQGDYRELLEAIPKFDYFLYTGLDEGSMGLLDALAAGVPTIVTPQGFHLDVPGGITHSFHSAEQLIAIFQGLARAQDARRQSVAGFTWAAYAGAHTDLWRALLDGSTAADFDARVRAGRSQSESALAGSAEIAAGRNAASYANLTDTNRWKVYLARRFPVLITVRDLLRRK